MHRQQFKPCSIAVSLPCPWLPSCFPSSPMAPVPTGTPGAGWVGWWRAGSQETPRVGAGDDPQSSRDHPTHPSTAGLAPAPPAAPGTCAGGRQSISSVEKKKIRQKKDRAECRGCPMPGQGPPQSDPVGPLGCGQPRVAAGTPPPRLGNKVSVFPIPSLSRGAALHPRQRSGSYSPYPNPRGHQGQSMVRGAWG